MYWLRFFSKVAFLCDLLFLAAVFLQLVQVAIPPQQVSTIVITGYFMAVFVFSPLVTVFYGVLWLKNRPLFTFVPRWLVGTNILFFLLQIIFVILFFNDKIYH